MTDKEKHEKFQKLERIIEEERNIIDALREEIAKLRRLREDFANSQPSKDSTNTGKKSS